MKFTEPMTHLSFFDNNPDGPFYAVTVPLSIAEEVGAGDMASFRHFLDAIENRAQFASFEVDRIDGDELAGWKVGLDDLCKLAARQRYQPNAPTSEL